MESVTSFVLIWILQYKSTPNGEQYLSLWSSLSVTDDIVEAKVFSTFRAFQFLCRRIIVPLQHDILTNLKMSFQLSWDYLKVHLIWLKWSTVSKFVKHRLDKEALSSLTMPMMIADSWRILKTVVCVFVDQCPSQILQCHQVLRLK